MIIVPDIHGRDFWKRKEVLDGDKVIFLGDYVDPYPHEGISPDVVPGMIQEIINIPGATRLLGNHDLSYVLPGMPRCRYSKETEGDIRELILGNREKFKLIHRENNYVYSHSGVFKDWLGDYTEDQVNELWWEKKDTELSTILGVISYYRGGYDPFGSCVWGDVREWLQEGLEETPGYHVFGHTMLQTGKIIVESRFACVDCQKVVSQVDKEFTVLD